MTPTTTDAAQEPTYTLDRDIARARREMGEARWAQLNSEWEGTQPVSWATRTQLEGVR